MKNLLNLEGAQKLSKADQLSINGGWATDTCSNACAQGTSNPYYCRCNCPIDC